MSQLVGPTAMIVPLTTRSQPGPASYVAELALVSSTPPRPSEIAVATNGGSPAGNLMTGPDRCPLRVTSASIGEVGGPAMTQAASLPGGPGIIGPLPASGPASNRA
ncbi:MAG TPA: hypothetical protein VMR14_16445 [Streptosporangiaceae bacterium]|nr:hypothetical protein [Streptosporangiaceae bacterium]